MIRIFSTCASVIALSAAASVSAQSSDQWVDCASENQTCDFSDAKLVRYGRNNTWVERVFTNTVQCSNAVFDDPLPGTYKKCQYNTNAQVSWETCADEQSTCSFDGKKTIRYGKNGIWVEGTFTDEVACSNSVFGDPLKGTRKECQTASYSLDDFNAPTPPTNIQMSNLTCDSGTLSWSASSDNVGVARYTIYRDGQFLAEVSGSSLNANLTLTPGADWGFYVNALDNAGNVSQASDTLQIQIPQCQIDNTPPSIPTDLQGSAEGTAIMIDWLPSTDEVGVTGYDIFRDGQKIASTPDNNYVDTGLAQDQSYDYTVAARDAQNNVSASSNQVTITTQSTCSTAVCAVDQVTTETDIPWGLVTLDDGSILYSRRDVHDIILLKDGVKTNIGTVPNVVGTNGEGGLLGLEVTDQFPDQDSWLYIYHTSPSDNRLVRIRYQNGQLNNDTLEVLLTGVNKNKFHNGGRLRFGPDGKLYIAAGDGQSEDDAQNINKLNGKILRVNKDGSIPSDNPFNNAVWSYGHRNPQGLAFDSQGQLWQQEFGAGAQDETNLIQKGGNYGWPECEGTYSRKGQGCANADFIPPKQTYLTANGSCSGIAIVSDVLYVACQRGERLYRGEITGTSLPNTMQQLFVGTYGRLRTVEPSIDGNLWLTSTNGGDKNNTPNDSDNQILKVTLGTGEANDIQDGATYSLTNRNTGRALDVVGHLENDGANVGTYPYNNWEWQHWQVDAIGDDAYTLTVQHTGMALSLNNSSNAVQSPYNNNNTAEWYINPIGNGYYELISVGNGTALDESVQDNNVTEYRAKSSDNQQWLLQRIN